MRSLCLIGMPGVGKSRIGKILARMANMTFIDTDHSIRSKYKFAPLQSILANMSSDEFLVLENQSLLDIPPHDDQVISPGGSAVFCVPGMQHIRSFATVVYLFDTVDRLRRRIPNLETRGIVGLTALGFSGVFCQRDSLYRQNADLVISIPTGFPFCPSPKKVALDIFKQVYPNF